MGSLFVFLDGSFPVGDGSSPFGDGSSPVGDGSAPVGDGSGSGPVGELVSSAGGSGGGDVKILDFSSAIKLIYLRKTRALD